MPRTIRGGLFAVLLGFGANFTAARAQEVAAVEFDADTQQAFIDGMDAYAARDYRHAELMFRRILDRSPRLLRVRLELARTLFMEKEDEQADYQFRLAAGEDPPTMVARNIVRFRKAIRARRSWNANQHLLIAALLTCTILFIGLFVAQRRSGSTQPPP